IRRRPSAVLPISSDSSMPLTGVESLPFLSRSTPPQRCHHKDLTDPLKLSDACCQNCASWTATSAALPRSETERFCSTILSCIWPNEANLSQSIQWLTNGVHILIGASALACSPDRKIKIRIRERLIVEREVPPLLVVGPKAAAGHRRGEQRAVLLRLVAHARIRRP